jgi:hypothetical protein
MVHVSLHWSDRGVDDFALWGFAVKHAAWLYNRIPNSTSGLTPLELLTKTKADHRDLLRSHVWGCPVFVLDPKLKDGKKIPKWNHHSRLGQSLGFSDEHSSLVANVRNLFTGFVSPQFHVVFDDLFQTVFSSGNDDVLVNRTIGISMPRTNLTLLAILFIALRHWMKLGKMNLSTGIGLIVFVARERSLKIGSDLSTSNSLFQPTSR